MRIRDRALAVTLGLVAAALLAGCDDGATGSATAPPVSSPVPKASATDPAIREAVQAAPAFDVGHTVHLTKAGIRPLALASLCCAPVVFKNETDAPITVNFTSYGKPSSGPIAPGASWQWTPANPESAIYHLGTDMNQRGQIQVESPDW